MQEILNSFGSGLIRQLSTMSGASDVINGGEEEKPKPTETEAENAKEEKEAEPMETADEPELKINEEAADDVSNEDEEEDPLSVSTAIEKKEAPQIDVKQLHGDPDFAAICSFFNKFGAMIGSKPMSFTKLERILTSFDEDGRINKELFDLHLALMRRIRMTSARAETWEIHLKKFLSHKEALQGELFQLERYGYIHLPVATKIQILKALCEAQFDSNPKLKDTMIASCKAVDLRLIPVGVDKNGLSYWFQQDLDYNIRVYTEESDDLSGGTWTLIVRSSEELDELIAKLKSEDLGYVKKELDAKQKAKQIVPEEGSMIMATKKGTFLDTYYDEATVKKMRETLLKQKEERRNRRLGKEESEKEEEEEEEEEKDAQEEELDRRLMPRRSAASRAVSNIKKFVTPSKKGPRRKASREEAGEADGKESDGEKDETEKKDGEEKEGSSGGDSSTGSGDDFSDEEGEPSEEEDEEDEFRPKSERKRKGKKRRRRKKKVELDEDDEDEDSDEEEVKKERKVATGEVACGQCQKSSDWDVLLLCDVCDDAWHTYCLKPVLWFVPDGDWFCPKCVHGMLIERLEEVAKCLDGHLKKKAAEDKKRRAAAERLKREMDYIGVSLNNIIPTGLKQTALLTSSSSSSSDDNVDDGQRRCKRKAFKKIAPRAAVRSKFQMEVQKTIAEGRSRRRTKQVDYNFADYDELIQEACVELGDKERPESRVAGGEVVRPSGGAGRGKDMANIVEAEHRRTGSVEGEDAEEGEGAEIERKVGQPARSVPKKGAKPRRRLNDLNVDNGDASDSEEYQANESEEELADEDVPLSGSDYVPSEEERRTRRSTRRGVFAPTQSDEDFVVSGSDESDFGYRGRKKRKVVEKKKKKKRGRWASESESEESEPSDGYSDDSEAERRKRKKGKGGNRGKWNAREEESEEEEEEVEAEEETDEDAPRTETGRPLRQAVAKRKSAVAGDKSDENEDEEEEEEEEGKGKKKKREERPVGALDRPRRAQIESDSESGSGSDSDEFKPEEEVEEEEDEDEEEEEKKEEDEGEEKDTGKGETQTRKRKREEEEEETQRDGAESEKEAEEDEEDDALSLVPKKRKVEEAEAPKEQKPSVLKPTQPAEKPSEETFVPVKTKTETDKDDPLSELKPLVPPKSVQPSTSTVSAPFSAPPTSGHIKGPPPPVSNAQASNMRAAPYPGPPNPYYQGGGPPHPGMPPYSMAAGYPPYGPPQSWQPANPYAPPPIGAMPSNPYAPTAVHNPYGAQPPVGRPAPKTGNLNDLQSL